MHISKYLLSSQRLLVYVFGRGAFNKLLTHPLLAFLHFLQQRVIFSVYLRDFRFVGSEIPILFVVCDDIFVFLNLIAGDEMAI